MAPPRPAGLIEIVLLSGMMLRVDADAQVSDMTDFRLGRLEAGWV